VNLCRLPAFLSTLFLLAAGPILIHTGSPHAQTWQLVWSDEFDGPANTAPNRADWSYDTGAGGWGNAEVETYCAAFSGVSPCAAGEPNTYLDGRGNLVIKALNHHGIWTSGRMITKGKRSFQYGRIEARMKLPVGAGFWPAFWMLASNIDTVQWPDSGEQDIMEWVQKYSPTTTSSTIHGPGYSGAKSIGSQFTFPHGGRIDDDSFHTYGVIWSKDKLQFYRDTPESPYFTLTPAQLPPGTKWVYNHPFYLLLNLAIGSGGFPGTTNAATPQSGAVLVDYVRVYQASTGESLTDR
jgi:beta-glucanase (GH16 family)